MLAVLAAFRQEIGGLLKVGRFGLVDQIGQFKVHRSDRMPQVVIVQGGFGRQMAQKAVEITVSRFRPDLIATAGFAGGTQAGQSTGQVVLGGRLLAVCEEPYRWKHDDRLELLADPAIVESVASQVDRDGPVCDVGPALTTPLFVSTSAMKSWLGSTFEVLTVDMESYWVAEAAKRHGVDWLAVRVVLDSMEQDVPPVVGKTLDAGPVRRVLRSAAHLATSPGDTVGLLKLAGQVRTAANSLGGVLTRISRTGVGSEGVVAAGRT